MRTLAGTLGIFVGAAVSFVALVMMALNSSHAGVSTAQWVLLWPTVFVGGVVLFGWGLGKWVSGV